MQRGDERSSSKCSLSHMASLSENAISGMAPHGAFLRQLDRRWMLSASLAMTATARCSRWFMDFSLFWSAVLPMRTSSGGTQRTILLLGGTPTALHTLSYGVPTSASSSGH